MCFYSDRQINMEDAVKQTQMLILSRAPSHRPAAARVASHWSATPTQVITIHHSDCLNTFLWPEGPTLGGRLQLSKDCYSEDKLHLHALK